MLKRIMIVGGTVLAMGFVVGAAMGLDNEPKKANKYQATGVNAYAECTAPTGTTAGALPLPACVAVDSGTVCQFSDKGSAKFASKAKDDVSLSVKVGGLVGAFCDGQVLQATADIQATTNDCTAGAAPRCSTVTLAGFPIPGATCTVAKGKCQIKTTVNTAAPGTIVPGKNTAIRLGSVALGTGTTTLVTAGVLVP
jgi:hypothetical protein